MGHCVFMVRPDSIYDDSPSEQYQFPKQYLERANTAVGDWIVYLEPKKVRETRGYHALARVDRIIPDPTAPGRFLALIEQGSYLDFPNPVPFNDGDGPVERGLVNEQGKLSGRAQAAVRPISPTDFLRILDRGLDQTDQVLPRQDTDKPTEGLAEQQSPFMPETERQRVEHLVSRPLRDRAFRRVVLRAYGERCAFTGLKFINGGGRAEVNAAHIKPVENNGPDIVHNGIALSGTAHWMFDRGLISLSNDLEILISRQVNDIASVESFINKNGRATPPVRSTDRPHPHFLEWHREHCFKS
ncbi:MAG: restriction endonuclease [Rhodospirillaceae bacterium]|jgi:putative restriction endonuclease|nr:restriction endonuclease [Rhodospirillaceae bacterium]MBT5943290.1 restriction endonuclease [Rhodospirillaceae bacterium]MBT6404802.1 restriction endonuclease [Rhodospirillaceae bacterium]MBT6536757.1 restriction endonuclease [Rhodospirillaceae bacterium]MBT7362641.1 restriction endonuclease [Rhodospirillaceae bacterium]